MAKQQGRKCVFGYRLNETIPMRCSTEERQLIEDRCKQAGEITASMWLHGLALKELGLLKLKTKVKGA
jgi:hypothetical protein